MITTILVLTICVALTQVAVLLLVLFFGDATLMTFDELNTKLDTLTTQVNKIGTESSKSLVLITQLQGEIVAGQVVPQATVDKLNALATQLQVVDDLVPDAPTPPSPPPPPAS
jgi:hypothetical protein